MIDRATVVVLNSEPIEGTPETLRQFSISLRNSTVVLCSLGASVLSWKHDNDCDIVLGYKNALTMFQSRNPVFFGTIVGRVANRIARGELTVEGSLHELAINDNPNHLHGGGTAGGFSHKLWDAEVVDVGCGDAVRFSLTSPDGDQGYPGSVEVTATYSLRPSLSSSGVVLRLDMKANLDGDKATPINLAQHSYFNLSNQHDDVLDHKLVIEADAYTPVDETSIPTREVRSLDKDTGMDWRKERSLRDALHLFGVEQVGLSPERASEDLENRKQSAGPYGFDHNYVVRKQPGSSIPKVAELTHSTRKLTVYSTAPGVQVYTANYLGENENSSVCKATYTPWSGLCLETQHFPDSVMENVEAGDEFAGGRCPILTSDSPDYKHCVDYSFESEQESVSEVAGCDTNGRKYKCREDMWKAQDLSSWYKRAKEYYEDNCTATIEGVLGGIGWISDIDLNGSRHFLNELKLPKTDSPSVACECGAGIGRVTKGLLLDFCDRSDLVESSERLLFASPEYIGNNSYKCRFFASELQEWEPPQRKYSVVWIQWVLCYLTDDDIVQFLARCGESLVDGGVIVLKENTCVEQAFVVDVDDASVTRSVPYWLDLIFKAGLKVVHHKWQEDFPDDIFPVPILALQPNSD